MLQTILLPASVLLRWHQEGNQNRAADECRDDGEGPSDREMAAEDLVEPHHFETDEDQNQAESVFQEAELVHDAGQEEEHGSKSEDGEDI